MLVPFQINQTIVTQFNIPQHIVDWHRVRILKEIDDIRFKAVSIGNIDLSLEALKSLKLFKICILANPSINDECFVTNIDPISYCYDISKEEILITLNEFFQRLRKRFGTGLTAAMALGYFDKIRNLRARLIRPTVCYNPNAHMNIPSEARTNEAKIRDVNLKYAENNDVYAWVETGDVFSGNEHMVGLWPMIRYASISSLYNDSRFFAMPMQYCKNTFLSEPSPSVSDISTFLKAQGQSFYGMIFNDTNISQSYGRISSFPSSAQRSLYPVGDGSYENSAVFSPTQKNVIQFSLYVDASALDFPVLMKAMTVQADVDAYIAMNSVFERTSKYISMRGDRFGMNQVETPAAAVVVSELPFPSSMIETKVQLLNPSNERYTLVIPKLSQYWPVWFKSVTFTLQNGKTYKMPTDPMVQTPSGVPYFTFSTYTTFKNLRLYAEANKSLYSFPLYYPSRLDDGSYRMRNGYLYSDANNFYELTFYKIPESTIDKMGTILFAQECIDSLRQDVADKFYITELIYEDSLSTTGTVVKTARYASYYWEFGIKREFVHPVSLKPITIEKYINELYFTMIVTWGEVDAEVKAFLGPLKIKNDAAYQKAYNNFLMGAATMKGDAAVAEYKRKLETGIFYFQNGFNYWRPFTTIELAVIKQLKEEAMLNKDIADKNAVIMSENARFLALVNQKVIAENEAKLALAKTMAFNQLKQIADADLAKIVAPTRDYLIARAEKEGGFPTDILHKWVQENPFYYVRSDLKQAVEELLAEMTMQEQRVATSLVADQLATIEITKAFQEMFNIK